MIKSKTKAPPSSTTNRDDATFSLAILLERFQIVKITKWDKYDFSTFQITDPPHGVLLHQLSSGTSWFMIATTPLGDT